MSKLVKLTTSELASALLDLKGKGFSLKNYEPFKEIYDCDPPVMTSKTSRQSGKSLSVGAIIMTKSVARPYFNSLYVAPLSQQVSRFNTMYLKGFFDSPLIRKHYRDPNSKTNVFEKSLNNGSIIFLSYAQVEQDADRVRGIMADANFLDETADIAMEAIPIIKETMSASQYGYLRMYGTPKSELNTLEVMFKRGNGLEWCTKCPHCGKWTIPDDIETCLRVCSGKTGPVCAHCLKPVDPGTGKWVAARPNIKDHFSFHIPRFILRARLNPKMWADIQSSITHYAPSKLANEVFGLAAGVAGRILSEREAIACCNPARTHFETGWRTGNNPLAVSHCVLGVDWSCTGSLESFTVVTILGYDFMGKCYVMYTERMNGVDILDQVRRVEALARQFRVQMVGSDRGVGVLQAGLLRQSLGMDKVVMIQYCAAKQLLRYDHPGGYIAADRTQTMDMPIIKMKLGPDKFETPCWEIMSPFWKDALALYEEESLAGRRLYRRDIGAPDDWLHSVVFGHIAYMCASGQFNYLDELPYADEADQGSIYYQ